MLPGKDWLFLFSEIKWPILRDGMLFAGTAPAQPMSEREKRATRITLKSLEEWVGMRADSAPGPI